MAIISKAERAAAAVQVRVNEVMTQMYPELLPKALDILDVEEDLLTRFPDSAAQTKELTQLKLDTLALNHRMTSIRLKREAAQKEVLKKVKAQAKHKPYGPYLDAKGILCVKKMRKDFKGKDWLTAIVDAYNTELVPYAKQLAKDMGADYTPAEKEQGEKLNVMLHRHNQLVTKTNLLFKAA